MTGPTIHPKPIADFKELMTVHARCLAIKSFCTRLIVMAANTTPTFEVVSFAVKSYDACS